MGNILDYLDWRGRVLPFESVHPFNEVDNLDTGRVFPS